MKTNEVKNDNLLVNSQELIKSHSIYCSILNFRSFLLLTILFFYMILSFPSIQADVISLNAGGGTEVVVTPDKYIEGFFSGIPGAAATAPTPTPSPGGGGAGGEVTPINISVTPTEFNINLAIDTTTQRTVLVKNLGTSTLTIVVSQQDLGNHVIFEDKTLTIEAGETAELDVVFVALSEPGVFTGKIIIGGYEVLVALNVKTKLLLFDSNIVVLNPDLTVTQGGDLKTLVTLIPLGDPERLDVTLNFAVKDYRNKVYLTKSETLLVDKLTELKRNFDTGLLSPGEYVISLELVYPNGVAPSSAHFRVVEREAIGIFGKIILWLIIMILVVSILIIIILIWRRRKKKKEEVVS